MNGRSVSGWITRDGVVIAVVRTWEFSISTQYLERGRRIVPGLREATGTLRGTVRGPAQLWTDDRGPVLVTLIGKGQVLTGLAYLDALRGRRAFTAQIHSAGPWTVFGL